MEKNADWVERKLFVPDEVPEKHMRIANIVKEEISFARTQVALRQGCLR